MARKGDLIHTIVYFFLPQYFPSPHCLHFIPSTPAFSYPSITFHKLCSFVLKGCSLIYCQLKHFLSVTWPPQLVFAFHLQLYIHCVFLSMLEEGALAFFGAYFRGRASAVA